MPVSKYKKHQMKIAAMIGLPLGFFLFLAFFAFTGKWITAVFIPITGLISMIQAYVSPE